MSLADGAVRCVGNATAVISSSGLQAAETLLQVTRVNVFDVFISK